MRSYEAIDPDVTLPEELELAFSHSLEAKRLLEGYAVAAAKVMSSPSGEAPATADAFDRHRFELERRLQAVEATTIAARHILGLGRELNLDVLSFRCGMRTVRKQQLEVNRHRGDRSQSASSPGGDSGPA